MLGVVAMTASCSSEGQGYCFGVDVKNKYFPIKRFITLASCPIRLAEHLSLLWFCIVSSQTLFSLVRHTGGEQPRSCTLGAPP